MFSTQEFRAGGGTYRLRGGSQLARRTPPYRLRLAGAQCITAMMHTRENCVLAGRHRKRAPMENHVPRAELACRTVSLGLPGGTDLRAGRQALPGNLCAPRAREARRASMDRVIAGN